MRNRDDAASADQTQRRLDADHAVELGKRRFLIELPTGTGKTDVICLHGKRMFKAGRAERLLFLVDREQLAEQAIGFAMTPNLSWNVSDVAYLVPWFNGTCPWPYDTSEVVDGARQQA